MGILSIIPPFLAIVLAVITKNVILSLYLGVFVGSLILTGGNPITAFIKVIKDYLFVQMTSAGNAQTLVAQGIIGGFVTLMEASGAAIAFATIATKLINSRRRAQIGTWLGGLIIFFSDSGSPLINGAVFRPITDGLRVSREKLSYILDSTASPVCVLIPIIGWGVYIMGLIEKAYAELGIEETGWTAFIEAIPFQFYSILAVAMVAIIGFTGWDFGPMARAEERALQTGKVIRDGATPIRTEFEAKVPERARLSVWLGIVPLVVLLVVIFAVLIANGFPYKVVPGTMIRTAIATGFMVASLVLIAMGINAKVFNAKDAFDTFIKGIQGMTYILIILLLAWSLGNIVGELKTAAFLIEISKGILSPSVLPALIFLAGAVTSFATGTSWGTFAILIPIAIPMAHTMGAPMYVTIAAVLSGGLFGDHCSPISDTTILSAMGASADLVDHVTTQLPYALTVAAAATVGYLIAGAVPSYWVLGLTFAILLVLIYIIRIIWTYHTRA